MTTHVAVTHANGCSCFTCGGSANTSEHCTFGASDGTALDFCCENCRAVYLRRLVRLARTEGRA